jgi:RHS repeat-associated protein
MQENRILGNDDSDKSLTRYIYSNHLQSSALELDNFGKVISYEEYHAFGTTSYHLKNSDINAVAKRYRYTGKERDEESGLYYHGARYYIPWLCRRCAVDPLESDYAGWSSYNYCNCSPVVIVDPTGKGGWYFDTPDKKGNSQMLFYKGSEAQFKKSGHKGEWRGEWTWSNNDVSILYRADGNIIETQKTKSESKSEQKKIEQKSESKKITPTKPKPQVAPAACGAMQATVTSNEAPGAGEGITLADAGRFAIGFVPFVGSGLDLYEGIRDGNYVQAAFGGVFLIVDFATFGGASAVKGGVKAALENSALVMSKKSTEKMLFREGTEITESASKELIEKVSSKRIVTIAKEGTEDLKYLEAVGAEASTDGLNILLRENASRLAVFEEFLHGTQQKIGLELGETYSRSYLEWHVRDFMIRHSKLLGLSLNEIQLLKKEILTYKW